MNSKRTKILTFLLVAVVVCIVSLTVVYAALSTTLNITGTADVVASTWDVHFTDANIIKNKALSSVGQEYSVLPLATDTNTCGDDDCVEFIGDTSFTFTTSLIAIPGDNRVVEFGVSNDGSIDAVLDSVVLSNLSSDQDVYINYYVRYKDGTIPKTGDSLDSGDFKDLILVVEFDKNITANQLPAEVQNLNLTFSMNYVQKFDKS